MNIAVYARTVKTEQLEAVVRLIRTLASACEELFLLSSLAELYHDRLSELANTQLIEEDTIITKHIDYCISIGGDGSFLDAATLFGQSNIPLLGVNFGRVGFLADVAFSQIDSFWESLLSENITIEQRALLHLNAKPNCMDRFGGKPFAINEITISKKDIATLIRIDTTIDGKHALTYWADGVMVSTPTGSTGYNLSCGGPIVFPATNCFIITPYASHNLNVRPLVLSDAVRISFKAECRTSCTIICTLDSRRQELSTDTHFEISKADFPLHIVRIKEYDFIDALTQKLHWGFDVRNG